MTTLAQTGRGQPPQCTPRTLALLLTLMLGNSGAAGCAASGGPRGIEDEGPIATRTALPAEHRKIRIGRVDLPSGTTAKPLAQEPGEPDVGGGLAIDPDAVREALARALWRTGCFEEVILDEDRADAAAVVVDTQIQRISLRRVEPDDGTALRVVTWVVLGFFANWIEDRTYALEIEPRFTFRASGGPRTVEGGAGRAQDSLNLRQRRGGVGTFAATVFCVPYFVFESRPSTVLRGLGPESLRGPADRIVQALKSPTPPERAGWRVRAETVVSGESGGVRARLLSPSEDGVIFGKQAELKVEAVATGNEALTSIRVGDQSFAVSGRNWVSTIPIDLSRERVIEVTVTIRKGKQAPVTTTLLRVHVTRESGKAGRP